MASSSSSSSSSCISMKRRKLDNTTLKNDTNKWKTQSQQQLYSSKLVQALRQRRNNNSASPREVRAEAERVLATAAKGRTRWSRAILSRVKRVAKRVKKFKRGKTRLVRNEGMKKKKMRGVERKMRMLGKLVPGCKGIPVTSLLDETGDYIAALQMQVKAMAAISQLLCSPLPDASIDLSSTTI